jgi:hypothetical protein
MGGWRKLTNELQLDLQRRSDSVMKISLRREISPSPIKNWEVQDFKLRFRNGFFTSLQKVDSEMIISIHESMHPKFSQTVLIIGELSSS